MSAPNLPHPPPAEPDPVPDLDAELPPEVAAELAPELKAELAPELSPSAGPGSEEYEPTTVALVFMLPPLALGTALLAVLFRHQIALDALGNALLVGLVICMVVFAVVRARFR